MLQKIANILWEKSPVDNELIVFKSQEIALEQEFPNPKQMTFSWASELTCDVEPLERLIFEKTHRFWLTTFEAENHQ